MLLKVINRKRWKVRKIKNKKKQKICKNMYICTGRRKSLVHIIFGNSKLIESSMSICSRSLGIRYDVP